MSNIMSLLRGKGRAVNKKFFGIPYTATGPDGVKQVYEALNPETLLKTEQVLFNTIEINPSTGEELEVSNPNITISVDDLNPSPKPGENWVFEVPEDAEIGSPLKRWVMNKNRFEQLPALGKIRVYLVEVEQK